MLVGFTASGLNDAKPTPVDPVMPGVEVMAEATEALIADSGIRMPPAGMKYVVAVLFVMLTTFAFFRGEPAPDMDSAFIAANLLLLGCRVRGAHLLRLLLRHLCERRLRQPGVRLLPCLCRHPARVARSATATTCRSTTRTRSMARGRPIALRTGPPAGRTKSMTRRRREYQRRLRRFLYAGSDAVMLEGVVERKSWLLRGIVGSDGVDMARRQRACSARRGDA